MKNIILLSLSILALPAFAYSQKLGNLISIGCNSSQKVYLTFSMPVQTIDISSADILVNDVSPTTISFMLANPFVELNPPTNGVIILADNTCYPIEIFKREHIPAAESVIKVDDSSKGSTQLEVVSETKEAVKTGTTETPEGEQYELNAKKASTLATKYANVGEGKNKIRIKLDAIAVDDKYVYLKITSANKSSIDYHVDFQGLIVKSSNTIKVIANTEEYIPPLYIYNEKAVIYAGETLAIVFVYPLFTVKETQNLSFFIKELNGGRDVDFEIKSNLLLKSAYNLQKQK